MMDRRTFLAGTGTVLLTAPLTSEAQQAGKIYRIALLDYGGPDPIRLGWWNALRQRLRELGYVEGESISFEPRWAEGDNDRLPKLAAELVGLRVDVIVTGGANAAIAAKRATSSIPIVMATGADPVAIGIVSGLRQPGGNVTGMTSIQSELAGKRLELVRILVPKASRIG